MYECPVCEMEVDVQEATDLHLTTNYENETYYFCSTDCKKQFDKNPEQYMKPE